MGRIRRGFTYANVMASVAVFIALGSGAYAAAQLGRNSVGTRQLKNGAVNGAKVKDGSLTGADINSESLGLVPNAGHANGADVSANAAALQGHGPSSFLGVDAKAADSARLEGHEAREFAAVMTAKTQDLPATASESVSYGPVTGVSKATGGIESVTTPAANTPLFARRLFAQTDQEVTAGNVVHVRLLIGGEELGLGCDIVGPSFSCIGDLSEKRFVLPSIGLAIKFKEESNGGEIPSMSVGTSFFMTP
jgi:hypothetical protein